MRIERALPAFLADDVGRVREQKARGLARPPTRRADRRRDRNADARARRRRCPRAENPARRQRIEQHVARFDDAIALTQLRFEERADAGLEQHGASIQILRRAARGTRAECGFPRRARSTFPTSRAARCRTSRRRRGVGSCRGWTRVSLQGFGIREIRHSRFGKPTRSSSGESSGAVVAGSRRSTWILDFRRAHVRSVEALRTRRGAMLPIANSDALILLRHSPTPRADPPPHASRRSCDPS